MKDKKLLLGLSAGCGCLTLFVVVAAVVVFVVAQREPPGPFAGEGSAVVVLTSEQGGGRTDAPIFVARLEALGVEARAEEVNDERIVLHLDRASDPGAAIAAVLPPRTLAMHLVAEDQGPLTGDEAAAPPGVSVRRGFGDQPPVFAAPDERSLAPVIARADGLEGRVAAIECQEGEYAEDPPCAAYLLEAPAGITNADVETALVSEDFANGFPTVRVELTSAGATRFAHLTGRGVRRKLAIVLDGEIVSAPVIQERIAGGVAQISLGEGSYQAQLEEAHGMAASLSTEPLSSTWVLAEER